MTNGREAWLALTLEDAIEPELLYHHRWDPSKRLLSLKFLEGFVMLSLLPFVARQVHLSSLIVSLVISCIFSRKESYLFVD